MSLNSCTKGLSTTFYPPPFAILARHDGEHASAYLLIMQTSRSSCLGPHQHHHRSLPGHGSCGANDKCTCYVRSNGDPAWTEHDCSLRTCPKSAAWVAVATAANEAHPSVECSNKGSCNRKVCLISLIHILSPCLTTPAFPSRLWIAAPDIHDVDSPNPSTSHVLPRLASAIALTTTTASHVNVLYVRVIAPTTASVIPKNSSLRMLPRPTPVCGTP